MNAYPDIQVVSERETRDFIVLNATHWAHRSARPGSTYLPQENVIFTGDIVVQSPVPYVTESFPLPWISVLRQLESHPYAAIVPGHGPVMSDAAYLTQLRTLFEAVSAHMAQLAAEGFTLNEARSKLDPEEYRRGVPAWQGEKLREDWKLTVHLLAERAWRGVRGQGS